MLQGGSGKPGIERISRKKLAGEPTEWASRSAAISLQLETGFQTNNYVPAPDSLRVVSIGEGIDSSETSCRLLGLLDAAKLAGAGQLGSDHFTHALDNLHPDRRVRISFQKGFNTFALFSGYPQSNTLSWSDRHQHYTVTCLSAADELLTSDPTAQVFARSMKQNSEAQWNPQAPNDALVWSLPLAYNTFDNDFGVRGNRAAEPVDVVMNGSPVQVYLHTYDGDPAGQVWNFADALRNLLYFYVGRTLTGFSVSEFFEDTKTLQGQPPSTTADPFERRMTAVVKGISLRSMNVKEALTVLCDAAGLHFAPQVRPETNANGVAFDYFLRVWATLGRDEAAVVTKRKQMAEPIVDDLARQAPFTDISEDRVSAIIDANRASFNATVTKDSRVISRPKFVGAKKRYEVTLLLRPGWKPFAQLDDLTTAAAQQAALAFWVGEFDPELDISDQPRSIYHAKHPNHKSVSDIGRLWVFPDTKRYLFGYDRQSRYTNLLYDPYSAQPTPLGRAPVYLDSDIGGGIPLLDVQSWVTRTRPFLPTIGRFSASDDRSPIVEFNFNAADPILAMQQTDWVRYEGQALIDTTRAALWFVEDNLLDSVSLLSDPSDANSTRMLEAIIEGRFAVRVTCTIEGDGRLIYEPTTSTVPFARPRSQIIDVSERFQLNKRRGQNSVLDAQPTDSDPQFETRDDTALLQAFGDEHMEQTVHESYAGPVKVPWIDHNWLLGDSFSGVDGLGISFSEYPQVVRKEITFDPAVGHATTYILGDLRSNPESGLE